MKTLIQLITVALAFGGLSAAATLFLKPAVTPASASSDLNPGKSTPATADHADKPAGNLAETDPIDPPAKSRHSELDEPVVKDPEHADESALAAAEPPRGHHADVPHTGPADATQAESAGTATDRPEARVAVRPPYTPEGDEAGGLINLLRERSRIATQTERKLAERQDAMQMIFDDLRSEQARTLKIRQRLTNELNLSRLAVDAALQAVDAERTELHKNLAESQQAADAAVRAANEERDKLKAQLDKSAAASERDPNSSAVEGGSPEDNANLKKMAAVFDSMPAENVAKVFDQLVKNQRMPSVVALLNAMKDRHSAKVLSVITDSNPELAAELSDRLKRLKSTSDHQAVK